MITQEDLHTIEQSAKELFGQLGVQAFFETSVQDDGSVNIAIELEEPQMFIGEGGETLFEIQHLLRLLARKKIAASFELTVDINEYRKSKESYLVSLANTTADEAVLLQKEKELPAMPARDRRIVHVALEKRGDVVSESRGEDPERKVVIKPKNV